MFNRIVILVTVFSIYLLTLSWPEIVFWNKLLKAILDDFSGFYLVEFLFGSVGLGAIIGLTRVGVLKSLASLPAIIAQFGLIAILTCVNIVGFVVTPYVVVNFSGISLGDFHDVNLLTNWIKYSMKSEESPRNAGRDELFVYALLREIKRGNIQRYQQWPSWLMRTIDSIRPFEICIEGADQYCAHKKETALDPGDLDVLTALRNRYVKINTSGSISIVNESGLKVIKLSLQSVRVTWHGARPATYLENNVDLPSEALTNVIRWVGSEGVFDMPKPVATSPHELDYANSLFFGRTGGSQGLESYELAEKRIRHNLSLDPNNPSYLFLLAIASIYTGKWHDAEAQLKQVLMLAPEARTYIMFQMGLAKYYQGNFSEAAGYYQFVVKAGEQGQDTWAKENLWWARDRFALATWRSAYKDAQSELRPFTRKTYGERIAAAEEAFDASLRDVPAIGPTLVHFHAAQFYTHLGEFDKNVGSYAGVDSLYGAAADRVAGLVKSEVLFRHGESLRARGESNWKRALRQYAEAIRTGECVTSPQEMQPAGAPAKDTTSASLGYFKLEGADVCVGSGYVYSNVQPLAKYLLLKSQSSGNSQSSKTIASATAGALAALWIGLDQTRSDLSPQVVLALLEDATAKGKPKFFPEIKVEFLSVLGALYALAEEVQVAKRLLELAIKQESKLFNNEGRSVDFFYADGRLTLAQILQREKSANRQKQDLAILDNQPLDPLEIIEQGTAYAIPNSYQQKQLAILGDAIRGTH